MFSSRKLLLALVCAGILLLAAGVQPEVKEPAINRLLSNDATVIQEARQELSAARHDLIWQLVSIVDDGDNLRTRPASVQAAMFLLGEMRATEAVKALVEHIAFPIVLLPIGEPAPGLFLGTHQGPDFSEWLPAVEALTKVGEPCLTELLDKLSATDNILEQQACLCVLTELRERDAASAMLVDAIAKEQDTKKQERLRNSLDMLLSIKQP